MGLYAGGSYTRGNNKISNFNFSCTLKLLQITITAQQLFWYLQISRKVKFVVFIVFSCIFILILIVVQQLKFFHYFTTFSLNSLENERRLCVESSWSSISFRVWERNDFACNGFNNKNRTPKIFDFFRWSHCIARRYFFQKTFFFFKWLLWN